MFANSMLDTSWAQRSRRGWMTLTSLGLQALAAASLLLLPLIGTSALPRLRPLSPPVSLAPPSGPPPTPSHPQSSAVSASKMGETCGSLYSAFQSVSRMSSRTRHRRSWVQAARMFRAAPAPAIPMRLSTRSAPERNQHYLLHRRQLTWYDYRV